MSNFKTVSFVNIMDDIKHFVSKEIDEAKKQERRNIKETIIKFANQGRLVKDEFKGLDLYVRLMDSLKDV